MRKSVKFLAVLLIFLMPLSAFAESWWSPNRVRVNLRVAGSSAEGGLGDLTMKNKCPGPAAAQCTAMGLADGTLLNTAAIQDKEADRVSTGLSIHYVMEMGMIVGIHRYSTAFTTIVTQTGDWVDGGTGGYATALGTALLSTLNGASYGPAGTVLAARKSTGYINFLDLGYFYDLKDIVDGMSISGGIGLPLLGNGGSTELAYGLTGYKLNGGMYTESLTSDGGSAMSYFVDYGYAFGIHEALFSIRNVKTESSATVSQTKGLGKILGKDKFESSGSSLSFSLGYGYIF
jgi:hypothetical protein